MFSDQAIKNTTQTNVLDIYGPNSSGREVLEEWWTSKESDQHYVFINFERSQDQWVALEPVPSRPGVHVVREVQPVH